ncbi:MAG: dTDP-4-dehydrorhamnose reductase [Sedimentisphaerales bacterium]|nr:dTDP-4-dehydrorhamnose reductase [Sedimentisphaerales bacterium]
MGRPVVAILGGRGMLGTDLAAACAAKGLTVRTYDLPEFDVTDDRQLREAIGPADAVLNCAAYTNVDGAETEAELAHRVNAEAVGNLGALARQSGKWVLHFSTDFVFDGTLDRPYRESDTPNPLNEYGRSKLAGERYLDESRCAHCIVRLEWTYGAHGKSFVTKLLERARHGEMLTVVDDQIGSPTATTQVAAAACRLVESRVEGLFHLAADGYVTRFGMAGFILDRSGLEAPLHPCRSSDYAAPAVRPLNSRFDCSKIQALLDDPIEPWQGPLERFVRRLCEVSS